jgi:hypothetical protein
MPALVAGSKKTWMAGTSPATTPNKLVHITAL